MDSNVQTKSPDGSSRRTKYVMIGLVAVICVLSYQLHKVHTIKKELVTRKSFLIGKLYECRVSSEKTETKLKEKRAKNEQLTKDLAAKSADYKQMSSKYDELETSYESKTQELQGLQKSAGESKNELSELKENYDTAMSSVKAMQGKLEDTIRVCQQHKENSRSLNISSAARMRELEACKQETASLEQEKEALVASEQDLRRKVEQMGQTLKSVRSLDANTGALHVQQPKELSSFVQPQPSIVGKVPNAEYVHSDQSDQNPAQPAQSTQNQDQPALTQMKVPKTTVKDPIQVTPTLKRPTAKQTVELFPKTKVVSDDTSDDNGNLI